MPSSAIFSADSLRALRDLNVSTLTSVARIDAPTTSSGAGGANVGGRAWKTVVDPNSHAPALAVPCRMAPLVPSTDSGQADQTVFIARWVVVFDLDGPPVIEGNRLTVTGVDVAGIPWTRIVLVIGSRSPRTFSSMRTYVCQDVGPGMSGAPT